MSVWVDGKSKPGSPVVSRLAIILVIFFLANGLLINFALPNLPVRPQITTTLTYTKAFYDETAHGDSWKAMRTALFYSDQPRTKPIYTAVYFENNVRFQYPPSSLLVLGALRGIGGERWIDDQTLNRISWWCVWGIALAVARIFYLARRRFGVAESPSRVDEVLFVLLAFALTLTFYPIVRGYYLGQIQVWIDLLVSLVVLAWLEDRRRAGGALLSLVCIIKPTLALVIVWAVLRRQWDFVRGFVIPMSVLALISLATYGWANHADYLGVLSYISRQGEIFHPNQSMNGLLHRLFHNGNSLVWQRELLMTYNPWVHAGTVISSLALIGAGLYASRSRQPRAGALELAIIIACTTLAAPTVWTHHYGVTLPLFAVALPALLSLEDHRRSIALVLLAIAYMMISNNFRLLNRLAETDLNILQSYVYFGGLLFLALLFRLRTHCLRE